MRVFLGIGKGVVHAVHYGIRANAQERRALCDPRANVEEALPTFLHGKGLVRGVAVVEKGLEEKGGVVVPEEKYYEQ